MILTDQQSEEIVRWMQNNYPMGASACMHCGQNQRLILDECITGGIAMELNGDGTVPRVPILSLHCPICGTYRHISAIYLERMGCPVLNFTNKKKKLLDNVIDFFKRKEKV